MIFEEFIASVQKGTIQSSALIDAFNRFAESSKESTMQGFIDSFRNNVDFFLKKVPAQSNLNNLSTLPFQSLFNIYLHLITNTKNIVTTTDMSSQMIRLGNSLKANLENATKGVTKCFERVIRSGDVG